LFAAGLSQSGVDKEGILGFLPADIDKEFRRAARLKCIFCHTGGAPVGCCDRKCKATFHFPCGRANKASFMFSGNYESYCVKHTPPESIPRSPEVDHQCSVCLSQVKPKQSHVSGTCCVGSIFHTRCIQVV
ncbi:G2/M phase-specific E3 ubiquitin-protein ligase, partial [Orchesella cincta]